MKRRIVLLVLTIFLWPALAFADYMPGQIIVKFKPGAVGLAKGVRAAQVQAAKVKTASLKALNAKHKIFKLKKLYAKALENRPDWKHLDDVYVLYFPATEKAEKVAAAYRDNAEVVEAELDSVVKAFTKTPNDPKFPSQYGLINTNMQLAWDFTTGTSENVVAVLDSGITPSHVDLIDRIDPRGYDFVNDDPYPVDDTGHGTVVSGIICATTNNAKGVAGVDWAARILPIKVINNLNEGAMSDILQGIAYANSLTVEVINMSFGQDLSDAALAARCDEAFNNNIVLVAAAGNDNKSSRTYPASLTNVIAVAAVDSSDKRSVWNASQASNFGSWVNVAAAGSAVWSTSWNGGYAGDEDGTSFASPYVAGLASLIRAAYPSLTSQQIKDRIINTTDDIDSLNPGYENLLGSGRINAYTALSGLVSEITSPTSEAYLSGRVSVVGSAAGWDFASYLLEVYQSEVLQITIEARPLSVAAGTLGTWETTTLSDGQYQLKLRALSQQSLSREAAATVFVNNTTPEARISFPVSGATIEGTVTILGTAEEQQLDYYALEYGRSRNPTAFEQIKKSYVSVTNSALGTWETAGLQGEYTLRLFCRNKGGVTKTATVLVSIEAIATTKEAEPQPGLSLTYALPNPFNRASTTETTFNYTLAGNFDSKIYLFDLTGTLIWQHSYSSGENGGKSGANNPPWDGIDLFGASVPAGVYLYQVVADGRVLARGKIIILN